MKLTSLRGVNLGEVRSFIVISDVHLALPNDELTGLFLETLDQLEPCEVLFLLGDIFDFVYARSHFFLRFWKEVFDRLERLSRRGTRVVFVEGNHDFGFEHRCPNQLRSFLSVSGDVILYCRQPHLGRITLRHGDDLVCRDGYLKFRRLVKSSWFQRVAGGVPGSWMQGIFSRWARVSRGRDPYRRLTADFFFRCLDARHFGVGMPESDVLILGHVHEHIDTVHRNMRCLAGPSWLQAPSVLCCSDSGLLTRKFLGGKSLPLSEGFGKS